MESLVKFNDDAFIQSIPENKRDNLRLLMQILTGSNSDMDVEDSTFVAPEIKIVHGVMLSDPNKVPPKSVVGDLFAAPEMRTLYRQNPAEGEDHLRAALRFRLIYMHQEHLLWPKGDNTPLCSSPDGKFSAIRNMECKNCADQPGWDGNRTKRPCEMFYTAYVLLENLSGLYVVKYKSFATDDAKRMAASIGSSPNRIFESVWGLKTTVKDVGQNKVQRFQTENINRNRLDPQGGEFALCDALNTYFKERQKQVVAEARSRSEQLAAALPSQSFSADQFLPPAGADDDITNM